MLRFKKASSQVQAEAAILDPENSPYPPQFELVIDGVDEGVAIEEFSRNTGDNGALLFDATLSGRLPYEIVNAPAQATALIGGIPIPIAAGRIAFPEIASTSSKIIIQSGAPYLNDSKLGSGVLLGKENLQFKGTASQLIRQVVKPSKAYGGPDIKIEKLSHRLKAAPNDPGFTPEQTVRDVLTKVAAEAKCVYRDAPFGKLSRFEALPDPLLGSEPKTVWDYEIDSETDFSHKIATDTLWFDVVVEKKAELTAMPPVAGFRARRIVPYKNLPFLPPPTMTDWVEVTDTDQVNNLKDARKKARELAGRYAKMYQTTDITVDMNLLLQMYDAVHLGEDVLTSTGTWRYEWKVVIQSLKDDSKTMTTAIEGRGHIQSQKFTANPPVEITAPSAQVVQTPEYHPYAYFDTDGTLQLDLPYCLNSHGIAWAWLDGSNQLWIDPDLSENRAFFDGSQLMIEVQSA